MKNLLITSLIFFQAVYLFGQNINPVWKFVGPHSTDESLPSTDPDYNPFRAGQIDDITVDPGNSSHIIVSSFFAGIWETTNYNGSTKPATATWHILPRFDNYLPVGMGCNGIGAVTFRNSNELYVGGCNGVYIYNFATTQWSVCGLLPEPEILINKIVFLPNNSAHVFLCTSIGLIKSTNAGRSWSKVNGTAGWIHSMVFIEKKTPGTYYWYIAGQNTGNKPADALLKESDNGGKFRPCTAYTKAFSGINTFAGICLGDQTAGNGNRDIYIYTALNPKLNDWTHTDRQIHKLTKNISTGSITIPFDTTIRNIGNDYYHNGPWRLIIGYDATNNHLIMGGVSLHAFNLTKSSPTNITSIHDDYHGIYINTSVSPNQIFLACDGGFASVRWNGSSYTSDRLNNGLDISLINGFSGASESDLYVYGQQDELYSGLYDEAKGKIIAIHSAGENDGGLIDKFNGNRLVISDLAGGNSSYSVSTTDPKDFSRSSFNSMHSPKSSPAYYLEPGSPYTIGQEFGQHPFFQELFRKERIYAAAKQASLFQFDIRSKKFVWKVRLEEGIQHFTCSPDFKSEACAYPCAPCTASVYQRLHYIHYDGQPLAVSFSQLDKNIMYLVVSKSPHPSASQVVRYIGNNRDSIWTAHYECQDNAGNPQWQLITPDWLNAPFHLSNTKNEIYNIQFTGVETSNWDKNKIYVSCSYDLNPPLPYKVLVYNASRSSPAWSDYSTGIPPGENVKSMVMDQASNDGIYLSTENGIYYRDAGMSAWVSYNNGAPGNLMPLKLRSTQMEINYKENTVRAGTYGRGIWKSDLVCPATAKLVVSGDTVSGYKEADNLSVTGTVTIASSGSTVFRATNSISLEPGFTADAAPGTNYFTAFIHGCTQPKR